MKDIALTAIKDNKSDNTARKKERGPLTATIKLQILKEHPRFAHIIKKSLPGAKIEGQMISKEIEKKCRK